MTVRPLEVVVRCKNEMPWISSTLERLARLPVDITVIDSGSTDGSLEVAKRAGVRIVRILPQDYVPGRVLNDAMRRTSGDVVAFVNADAIPLHDDAAFRLASACRAGAAAAYGRQAARASARAITRIDHDRCFPRDPRGPGFRHFFSMAASAIRRDVWEALPFDDGLRYSEDVDWTWRLKALGLTVAYVPDAEFEHSHDYDARAMYRRMLGEGRAHGVIFREGRESVGRGLVRPLMAQIARDVVKGRAGDAALRVAAQVGRFRGRADGAGVGPVQAAPKASRYTLEGDAEGEAVVETALAHALAAIRETPARSAVATLLLGGFAYGEGAIERSHGGARVHNDIDLVVVTETRREAARLREACREASERATARAGVPVDVWPASRGEIANPRGRLLWIDAAVRGVKVLAGDASVVAPLARFGARDVRAGEIGRLLANRATGLALSRLALERGEADPRAARHVAKAWLAVGDALLLFVDHYAPRIDTRQERLARLAALGGPHVAAIAAGYGRAVAFRKHPAAAAIDSAELAVEARALWDAMAALEAHRIGVGPFADALSFARSPAPVFEAMDDVHPLARVLGGARAALAKRIGWSAARRHPRDALARVSVVLAYAEDRSAARAWAQRLLKSSSARSEDVSAALERLREVAA
jgi:hypothetical protein